MNKFGVAFDECKSVGTVIYVAKNGKFLGSIVIADEIEEDAKEAIAALTNDGIKTVMLNGRQKAIAENIASKHGLSEVRASILSG